MKVKVKKAVWFQGELHKVETVLDLSQGVGESWINRGIADAIDELDAEQPKKSRKKKAEQQADYGEFY